MRTSIKSCVLAVLGAMILPIVAMADYTCRVNGYSYYYSLTGGNATLTGVEDELRTNYVGHLEIPSAVDGYPLVRIQHDTFNSAQITGVTIPEGVEVIERAAFCWTYPLVYVDIPSTIMEFGYFSSRPMSIYGAFSSWANNSIINPAKKIGNGIAIFRGPPLSDSLQLESTWLLNAFSVKFYKRYASQWFSVILKDHFRGYLGDDYKLGNPATIFFVPNGGDEVAPVAKKQGDHYTGLPTPSRLGYVFDGWYSAPYIEEGFPDGIFADERDIITESTVTLYAKWHAGKPTWMVESLFTYDGNPHGITVVPTAPVEGVTVKYASVQEGPYTDVSPTLTEAGSTNVWYVLKAPDWVALTNSATLKITKLVSDATVAGFAGKYDGAAHGVIVDVRFDGEWYVSTSGNDELGTGSSMHPFKTIQKAVDLSNENDTIRLMPGTYDPFVTNNKRITISAEYGAGVTLVDGKGSMACVDTSDGGDICTNTTLKGITFLNGKSCQRGWYGAPSKARYN